MKDEGRMMRERKGFTLIELLVVIAVIALLLAILMPALRAAKGQGQMAACSAQLRQFGLAWSQYADDNDGFNIEYAPSSQWASGGFWFYQLGPYFSAKDFAKGKGDTLSGVLKILRCPAAKVWRNRYNDTSPLYGAHDLAWHWDSRVGAQGREEVHEGSYTLNGWMQNLSAERKSAYDAGRVRNYYFKYDDARVESPLISDGGWVDAWPDNPHVAQTRNFLDLKGAGIPGAPYRMSPNQFTRILLERHGRGINILFKGAHVQRVALERVGQYKWHRYFTPVGALELP
jgi:prepilin-type N-terminal cleavage/methylation domain-containing protein